ncbi:MAG: hypothetical protein V1644_01595 [Candidatus Micrarchaeota archaeon]
MFYNNKFYATVIFLTLILTTAIALALPQQIPLEKTITRTLQLKFQYGTGDAINYQPYVTSRLEYKNANWFNSTILPENWPSWSSTTMIASGPCLTSRIETATNAEELLNRTREVISQCNLFQAPLYKSRCAYGTKPQWKNSWRIYNPDSESGREATSSTISQFGEFSWCNWQLNITKPLNFTVNVYTNDFLATWETNMLSGNDVLNITRHHVATTFTASALTKRHEIRGNLNPDSYRIKGQTCTASEPSSTLSAPLAQCINFTYLDSEGDWEIYLIIYYPEGTPILTFIPPTPANNTTQRNGEIRIEVSSNTLLSRPLLHWISNSSRVETIDYMTTINATRMGFTKNYGVQTGVNQYYVTATDNADRREGRTETRTIVITD